MYYLSAVTLGPTDLFTMFTMVTDVYIYIYKFKLYRVAQWSGVELRSPPNLSTIAPFSTKYLQQIKHMSYLVNIISQIDFFSPQQLLKSMLKYELHGAFNCACQYCTVAQG